MKKIPFFLLLLISYFSKAQVGQFYLSRIFNVNTFGAVHNGSTDDQPAIQRAVNAAVAAGGGTVKLSGNSNYAVNSTITVNASNVVIEGEGTSTVITGLSDFGNIIAFIPATNPPTVAYALHDVGARNFSIQSAVARTSGYAIYSTYTHNLQVRDVVVGFFRTVNAPYNTITPFFNGIAFANESNFVMSNTQIYSWHEGVYVSGKAVGGAYRNTNNFDGLITGNCLILGDTTKWHNADTTFGLKIDGGIGGIQLEESNISFYTNDVRIDANTGLPNAEIYLNHAFSSDNSGMDGIYATPNSFHILQITGGWSSGSGRSTASSVGSGVHISSPNAGAYIIVTGGTIYANTGYGLLIDAGSLIETGTQFYAGTHNALGDISLGSGCTAATITSSDAVSITNASSITPTILSNNGYGTNQTSYPTNNQYQFSTSSTGSATFALLNNSSNFISDNMYGSAFAGNAVTGLAAAGISSRITVGAPSLIGTASASGGAPLYIGSNMNLSGVSYQMKFDVGTIDFYNVHTTTQSTNGLITNSLNNTNTGTSVAAGFHLTANDKDAYIYQTPSNYSSAAIASALVLQPQSSTGKLIFYSNAGQAVTMLPTKEMLFGGATTNNSAWVQMAAGTTTEAQQYFASSTAPTTPTNGMLWYDGTHFYFHSTTDHDLLASGGGGITGSLTSGRVTLSSGTSTVTDDAGLTFNTSTGAFSVVKNLNGGVISLASNNNTGASAFAGLEATGSTYSTFILQYGSGTTPAGAFVANAGGVYHTGTRLVLMDDNASGELDIAVGAGASAQTKFKADASANFGGALYFPFSTHAANYSVSATDVVVEFTTASTCTLPTSTGNTGRILYIKNRSAGNVTLSGMATGEFVTMASLGSAGASATLYSDGAGNGWKVVSYGD